MTEPTIKRAQRDAILDRRVLVVGKLGSMRRKEIRELIRQAGGWLVDRIDEEVDLVVVGAEELFLDDSSATLSDWMMNAAEQGSIEIVSEVEFCQMLGLVDSASDFGQLYTPAMLADLLQLPLSTIRRWHRRGLIRPVRQIKRLAYFDFQEVASARRIAKLVASGAPPKLIEAKLSRLAALYPHLQRPLTQLSIIVEGEEVLLRQGAGLIEPSGQKRLIFELNEPPVDGTLIKLPETQFQNFREEASLDDLEGSLSRFAQLTTPLEYIELASELEDRLEIDSAIECYRAMMLAFGPSADACFRMAELLYQKGELPAARERYYSVIELDESYVEARAALGCVLIELSQPNLAYAALKGALSHHPDYPDVHFHLARLLDDLDRVLEGEFHWKQFLKLAPQSPWANEARQRLGMMPHSQTDREV
jgi:tetratricopeptide (TPR) repeat protein